MLVILFDIIDDTCINWLRICIEIQYTIDLMIICFISTEIDGVVINFTMIFWSIIEIYNVLFSFSFHVHALYAKILHRDLFWLWSMNFTFTDRHSLCKLHVCAYRTMKIENMPSTKTCCDLDLQLRNLNEGHCTLFIKSHPVWRRVGPTKVYCRTPVIYIYCFL